jgi:hypothetical protein
MRRGRYGWEKMRYGEVGRDVLTSPPDPLSKPLAHTECEIFCLERGVIIKRGFAPLGVTTPQQVGEKAG